MFIFLENLYKNNSFGNNKDKNTNIKGDKNMLKLSVKDALKLAEAGEKAAKKTGLIVNKKSKK